VLLQSGLCLLGTLAEEMQAEVSADLLVKVWSEGKWMQLQDII
jgi:hypothetical protein